MAKQIPDASQDPGMKKDAGLYAESVFKKLKAEEIKNAIEKAYLLGAKSGFCYGYRYAEIEHEKEYARFVQEYKKNNNK